MAGCSNCGGSRRQTAQKTTDVFQQGAQQANMPIDSEFVLAVYIWPKGGKHNVTGMALFPEPIPGYKMIMKDKTPRYSIRYGYHSGGGKETFLVHKEDIKIMPGKFRAIEENVATNAPEPMREPLGVPKPIDAPAPLPAATEPELPTPSVLDELAGGVLAETPVVVEERVESTLAPPELVGASPVVEAAVAAIVEPEGAELLPPSPLDVVSEILQDVPPTFDPQKIPGVSAAIAERMSAAGAHDAAGILALGVEGLKLIKGVGERRAELIIRFLQG